MNWYAKTEVRKPVRRQNPHITPRHFDKVPINLVSFRLGLRVGNGDVTAR